MRSDAALFALTEEQQADLFDWLTTDTYEVVLKRIAQPPPKGFGIKTHINSLYRFYEQRQAQLRAHDLHCLSSIKREGGDPDEPNRQALDYTRSFYAAAASAFAHSTYILANSPLTPATYRTLSRTLHQREDISVKREYLDIARQQLALGRDRLQLERTQFEYNAARAAIALLPELIAIDQLTDIDDESKIWRVRERLFGTSGSTPVSGVPVGVSPTGADKTAGPALSAVSKDL